MKTRISKKRYVICVKDAGYQVSLQVRKIYQVISDPGGAEHGLIRVIDESGEDYLYPEEYFIPVDIPKAAQEVLSPDT